MNKIDLSAIRPRLSRIEPPEQEEHETLTKHSSLDQQLEKTIRPLRSRHSEQSEHTKTRKYRLFKEFEQIEEHEKKEATSDMSKSRIQFKIPPVQEYYIKQSKQNLLPNRVHRFQSLIEDNSKEDKKILPTIKSDNQLPPLVTEPTNKYIGKWIILPLALAAVTILFLLKRF